MMTRHPRTPALIILAVAALLGGFYVTAWGRIEKLWKKTGDQTVESLEKRIAAEGKTPAGVSAATWRAYAEALADAKRFAAAAAAYKEVIALQPGQRDPKFQRGLALAQAGKQPGANPDEARAAADEFYSFQKELVYGEAKIAVDLFDRPEGQKYLAEERFVSLAKEAKNQAMD